MAQADLRLATSWLYDFSHMATKSLSPPQWKIGDTVPASTAVAGMK